MTLNESRKSTFTTIALIGNNSMRHSENLLGFEVRFEVKILAELKVKEGMVSGVGNC